MESNRQLQYLIKVVDQASADIAKISAEMQKLDTQNVASAASVNNNSASVLRMAAAFGIATTTIGALQQVLQFTVNQYQDSVKAANQYNTALIGLNSVAAAFGQSQDKARAAAQSLAKDGLMSVSESAAGLKNLLASHFNLDESVKLMDAFKDSAAFNRQGMLQFGQAIVGATEGIKNQNSIMVDNAGITKNLSVILQQAGYSQQDLQRVTTDAGVRQALYNGLLREGAVFAGDAARAAQTLSGSQSQLDTAMLKLHNSVGQALSPAIILLNQNMTDATNAANAGLEPAIENIAKALVIAAEVASVAAIAIKSAIVGAAQAALNLANGMNSLQKMDFAGAGNNFLKLVGDLGTTFDEGGKQIDHVKDNTQKILNKIATEGVGKFGDVAKGAMTDLGDSVDKNGDKIAKKLEQIEQKIADITRNISQEVTAFTRSVALATADFDRQISDLVVKHREAAEDLRKQISDLNGDFDEANKDRLSSHDDRVVKIKGKYAEETKTLEDNLKRQLGSSKTSDQQLVKFFQAQIDAKNAARDKELKEESEAFEKEEQKAKDKYNKQLSDLQKKLNAEMEVQKKHADDFAKFKDAVNEDDITRAEQAFSRQMDQMKYQHDLRMSELERELQEEQALKNKYLGTGGVTSSGYKATGNTNYKAPAPAQKNYSNTNNSNPFGLTINFTQNNSNAKTDSAALKQALPTLGWLLK